MDDTQERYASVEPVPFYSRDIEAIWQVVDALAQQERPWHLTLTHRWSGYAVQFHRGFEPEDVSPGAWVRDKDAAAAIARAALLTTLEP